MLRRRWKILIGVVAIALLGGAFFYPRKPDPFEFLKPYAVSDTTDYQFYDPSVAGDGFWTTRHIMLTGKSTRAFRALLVQHFPAAAGWETGGTPGEEFLIRSSGSGDWITDSIELIEGKNGVTDVECAHKLSAQEVWWVRLIHIGHNPFTPSYRSFN